MIHEEGRLQIIDFGVAGTLVNQEDKRTTVIGTPHWMGPEVFKGKDGKDKGYGTKVRTLPCEKCKCPVSLTVLITWVGRYLGIRLYVVGDGNWPSTKIRY